LQGRPDQGVGEKPSTLSGWLLTTITRNIIEEKADDTIWTEGGGDDVEAAARPWLHEWRRRKGSPKWAVKWRPSWGTTSFGSRNGVPHGEQPLLVQERGQFDLIRHQQAPPSPTGTVSPFHPCVRVRVFVFVFYLALFLLEVSVYTSNTPHRLYYKRKDHTNTPTPTTMLTPL
jgi:hypothetical protein